MSKMVFGAVLILMAVIILITGLFFFPVAVEADGPWYVSPGGDNSDTCTSPETACLTINGALAKASYGDTIFIASGTYTGSDSEVVLINKGCTLSGGWDPNFTVQDGISIIDGQTDRRGIKVERGATAYIERFTIQNGEGDSAGGIWNDGNLTLNHCTVSDNVDVGDWTSEGGGIRNGDTGTLYVNNSTINDNVSSCGAAIFNAWGNITITNSTISGNSASGFAGAINNLGGSAHLNNVTITNNTDEGTAGGIHNEGGGSVYLQNSIIAHNDGYGPDCNGSFISYGYNLIGDLSGCSITFAAGDLIYWDPLLDPLADNGGPTRTHALLFRSPAINGGNPDECRDSDNNLLDFDQRGFPRVQLCDIGAFEFQAEIQEQYLPLVVRQLQNTDHYNGDN